MTEAAAIQKALKDDFPDSTEAECFRFVQAAKAVHKNKKVNKKLSQLDKEKLIRVTASQKLEEYLEWRSCFGLDYDRPAQDADDKSIWDWAVRKALDAEETKKREAEAKKRASSSSTFRSSFNNKSSTNTKGGDNNKDKKQQQQQQLVDYDSCIDDAVQEEQASEQKTAATEKKHDSEIGKQVKKEEPTSTRTLPQLIFKRTDPKTGEVLRDKNGTELIHVLAARIDRFAAENETWALAVALYIDVHVDRNSYFSASIMVDARAGPGWPNPVLIMVVSLIGQVVSEIEKRHPGRCKTLIIFPLPRALMMVWGSVKGFFSPEINEMMVVCSGPSDLGSPLPKKKLQSYVDGDTLELLEKCRIDLFDDDKGEKKK